MAEIKKWQLNVSFVALIIVGIYAFGLGLSPLFFDDLILPQSLGIITGVMSFLYFICYIPMRCILAKKKHLIMHK